MSEELIRSLNKRIDELQGENAQLRSESKDRRLKTKKLREEQEALQQTVKQLEGERDEWRQKYESSPSELGTRHDELLGKYRTLLHRTAFEQKAAVHKVRPEAVEALWKLSDYQADSDEVDEARMEQVFAEARQAHKYLFQPDEDATPAPNPAPAPVTKPALVGAVGNGRGGSLDPNRFLVRKSDTQNADWMMKNQARMAEAAANGSLVLADG